MNRSLFFLTNLLPALLPAVAGTLADDFLNPPADTRPWCYWYWVSDNLSKEGITRDLEAMARVGIGEAFIGNVVSRDTPPGDVKLLTDEWFDCMTHAVVEGKRLGVNISAFNSPGWSQSGGPWVTPDRAMRHVACSETRVKGPALYEARLPVPKEPFQDIAVLAFPAPRDDEATASAFSPTVVYTPEIATPQLLLDGDTVTAVPLPAGASQAGQTFTVDFQFSDSFTARSLTLHTGSGSFAAACELQAGASADTLRPVRGFVMDRRGLSRPQFALNIGFLPRGPSVISFPATSARFFRLIMTMGEEEGKLPNATPEAPGLAEISLSGAARLDHVIEKQLAKMHPTPTPQWDSYLWPPAAEPEAPELAIAVNGVIDLTEMMAADGTLRWQVPAGEWIIQRTGMTPTGVKNHPTTDEGRGLEVDKMSRAAIEAHFNAFFGRVLERVPPAARGALNRVVIDSYEVGSQNWTDGFHESFHKAFGYDPRPWLPVLSGRIIGSAGLSDRFLWDLRRHIADRIGTEYVGGLRDIANRHGLRLWLQNYGHWGFPGEFLQYGGQSDDLSGEFWVNDASLGSLHGAGVELRAASSAAHLYGKRKVYAEAFTSGRSFLDSPGSIKSLGDWAFCQGINHFVLHVYIHQPWDDRKPGVNAWFGTEFNRHNTWFEMSKPWIDYLRRCHLLLRQGTSQADVAYFIGEDTPKMSGTLQPAPPAGYDYDFINAESLLERAGVINGRLAIQDGPSYALLVLPPMETMRPALLRRIKELVAAGAAVLGPPPSRSPSMVAYPDCDREVRELAAELWGKLRQDSAPDGRAFGKGRVFHGNDLAAALRRIGVAPAVTAPAALQWTHRKDGETDLFFLTNPRSAPLLADVTFLVTGRTPELWHADTGERESTAWFEATADSTRVPIALGPGESVFVVFRSPMAGGSVVRVSKDGKPLTAMDGASPVRLTRDADGTCALTARESGRYTLVRSDGRESTVEIALPPAMEIATPWTVRFPGISEGKPLAWPRLVSWSEHAEDAVKHFSGTATYSNRLHVTANALAAGRRLMLDLGTVEVIAGLRINGKDLGVLWKRPFAADITRSVRAGDNEIEIHVTNLWQNRLIGDEKLPPGERTAFTTAQPLTPRGDQVLPSGLLGPVRMTVEETRICK